MKVLHVLYSGLGGHGNVFFSMVSADKNHDFEYEALFYGIEEMKEEYIQKCTSKNIPFRFVKKKSGFDSNFYSLVAKNIIASNADILFLHGSSNIAAARLAKYKSKKKVAIIVRETQSNKLKNKRDWFWLRLAFLLSDKIVFLSKEYQQEILKKFGNWYKPKKVTVIPNGIDLDVFSPAAINNQSELTCMVGMQSRLVKIKDYETLIKSIKILTDKKTGINYILKIAGEGDNKEALVQLVNELDLNNVVEFTGMLNENDLVKFLNSLDIYVHATLGETMSTSIMQAMACCKPIVASDVAGVNNMIIQNQNGLLVSPKNEIELSNAISLLAIDKNLAKKLAENAYSSATEKYSNTIMFKNYKKVFESIAN